jgi:NAD+ synthase (glutamine-hydrolysing)
MKIAACSLNQIPLDWTGNLFRIQEAIDEARKQGARLLLCPELSLTGYGCEDYFLMPWVAEKAFQLLISEILPLSHGLLLAVGLPYSTSGKRYNGLAVCRDGQLEGIYLKQILARDGVFYEPRWFDPWLPNVVSKEKKEEHSFSIGDFTVNWNGMEVGFEICEDAWHPTRRPALFGAAQNAGLILNPSASNFARGKQEDRHAILTSLSSKPEVWYLYANLLGNESGRLIFDGEIFLGKGSQVLASSPLLQMKEVVVKSFDLQASDSWTLAHQEDDFEEFTAAASLGLLDYLRKSGSKGFALSLSGGADSAACAVLVSEMLRRAEKQLGKNNLEIHLGFSLEGPDVPAWTMQMLACVYQGTKQSGSVTRNAARQLANSIGARYSEWEIDAVVDQFTKTIEKDLGRNLSWATDDLALQNIQARSRAPGIWMLANTFQFLLLTTSNRSEGDVGYCTMDGDTSGSLAPLAGVSKHFIRQWLIWARNVLGYTALDAIIGQAPTAELRPPESGQTDEGDLMPYELMEAIEERFLFLKLDEEGIVANLLKTRSESPEYLKAMVSRFTGLWKRNQWKRERLAPSFHLDRFNIDPKSMGRFPIFSR